METKNRLRQKEEEIGATSQGYPQAAEGAFQRRYCNKTHPDLSITNCLGDTFLPQSLPSG